ncbi:MAG: 6-phosphofructokinase, partial [Myxococcota bacterium]
MKRVALLTSGGDAPGMNAAIRAATLLALHQGVEVFGVRRGYRGLVENDLIALKPGEVARIIREGGTILGSTRCLEFHQREIRDRARAHLAERGIDSLVVIGGNGSLTGMQALIDPNESDGQLKAIGIPASIDNDVGVTRLAIGVDTAINTIVEACDKLSDTASAHNRAFIVEVMGRQSGYLAMTSAIASAANAVLFPEMNRSEEEIVDVVVQAVLTASKWSDRPQRVLVIKAEGVPIGNEALKSAVDTRLKQTFGDDRPHIETRITVLGHVVRGGRPSALDRQIAGRLANAAITALAAGQTNRMAAWTPADQ